MKIIRCLSWFALAMFAMSQVVSAASLTYSDGSFATNWSVTAVGQTGSVSAAQVTSGGNPDAFWQVTNNVATTNIEAISLRSDFTFDPAIAGGIQDLSFSYDAITQIHYQGQGTAPALSQNGVIFELLPENSGYYTSFQSLSFATLSSSQFYALDGSNAHPDFSAAGAKIVFGFANGNTGTAPYSNRTTQSDYDNFSVTVDYLPIPEPRTNALLLSATALLLVFVRNRRSLSA